MAPVRTFPPTSPGPPHTNGETCVNDEARRMPGLISEFAVVVDRSAA